MRPFISKFKSLGEKETRAIQILGSGGKDLPPVDKYAFVELYCEEKGCDCRRVMINVYAHRANKIVATISMGFDAEEDEAGPFLDPLNPQSRYSPFFLQSFIDSINNDPEYLRRLQRHYVRFKEKVDGKPYQGKPFEPPGKTIRVEKVPFTPEKVPVIHRKVDKPEKLLAVAGENEAVGQPVMTVGRNHPCPCGSGKKYKKCCMLKDESAQRETASTATEKAAPGRAAQGEEQEDVNFSSEDMSVAEAFVRTVAGCLKKGDDASLGQNVQEVLERNSQIAFALLSLLLTSFGAKNREKHRDDCYRAILILLEEALTQLRYSVERGRPWAISAANQIQETIAEKAFRIEVDATVQAELMQALYSSKLALHPAITAKREELAGYYGRFTAGKGGPDIQKVFERIAKAGPKDPFDLHEQLMSELSDLSSEFLAFSVIEMVRSHNPVLGDAAILMLLHPNREARTQIASVLHASGDAGALSPVGLRRMIGLRNWLPKEERPHIDRLIKAARVAGVVCAAMPTVQGVETYASVFDGAGMQAMWGFSKRVKDFQMANILVKQGQGIRETWGERSLKKGQKAAFIHRIAGGSGTIRVEPAYLEKAVRHFLWVGQEEKSPPPPGLLQAAERLADTYWTPKCVDFEQEIEALRSEMPPKFLEDGAIADALEESRAWPDMPFGSSWFEDDARVDALVKKAMKGFFNRSRHLANTRYLILKEVLEEKRRAWAERLFWMALRERSCRDKSRLPWPAFLIVSGSLLSGAPLERIPLMGAVAERSVLSGLRRIHEFPD